MVQMHIYGILALLEIFVLVSGVAVYLYLRNRKQNRTISRLQSSLNQKPAQAEIIEVEKQVAASEVETQSYSDFLRDELDASNTLLGTDGGASGEDGEEGDSEADLVRHMLAARHQFLQLELDAQAMGKDPEAKRKHIVEQMQGLLATLNSLRSEPEPETETVEEEVTDEATLAREKQLESQISHLRTVINNQQDVMRELRELLEKEMSDSEEMRAIVSKLQDAEARSIELERSLEVMEKDAADFAVHSSGRAGEYDSTPDSDMLRDLVGSQQQTINNLQMMLKQTVDDSNASVELRDAIEKIQRSNQELGTCVMVLEDENTMLRDQIESLHAQLENFMGSDNEGEEEMPTSSEIQSEIDALPDEAVAEASEVPETDQTDTGAVAATDVSDAMKDGEAEAETAEPSILPTDPTETEAVAEPEASEPQASEDDTAAADDQETPPADEDIDALLQAEAEQATDTSAEIQEAGDSKADVDDIDALLDEVAASDDTGTVAESPAVEEVSGQEEDLAQDEDVDALLEAVQIDAEPADQAEPEIETEKPEDDGGINTLKDIDIANEEQEDLSDDEIEALLSGENKS